MTHKPEKAPHELTEAEMLDPHGNVTHDHVILPVPLLLSVLIALLALTVLTVAASRAEMAISAQLNVEIPQWVNVAVAMSIAVVKAVIVAMFFMQLKYDNKLNSVVIVVSLGCVGLFLGFSVIDLGYRGIINPIEQHDIQAGGTGIKGSRLPVIEVARQNEMDKVIAEEGVAAWEAMVAEHHGDDHGDEAAHRSSSQRSRPKHGPTGLFDGGSAH